MPDPLEGLREPVVPIHPDPEFAADLRARIVRALRGPTGGAAMPTTTTTRTAGVYPSLTPYIAVVDAGRALDWYVAVFAAERRGDFIVDPDGKIGHAELAIGDAVLMLGEDRRRDPYVAGSWRYSIFVRVPDADATVGRAVAEGARLERPVNDEPYGRTGVVVDPFGHRWIVSTAMAAASAPSVPPVPEPRHGELGFVTVRVPDVERAKRFYGAVLGWAFPPGEVRRPPLVGIWGEVDRPSVDLLYRVDDLDAALGRVRAEGGRAEEPTQQHWGRVAACVDDQGAAFSLWEP
jgi:uncharacterized glyoxalase superfamily protein PhnB